MDENSKLVYEFGPFRLEAAERRLLHNGHSVPLTAKVFDILLFLVQRNGHLVQKGELLKRVWPDNIVEENNLSVSIALLRKALGESHNEHQYIETVPKHGYRFIAEVREDLHVVPPGVSSTISFTECSAPLDTLAVLPFFDEGHSSDFDYLSDGLTETIINNLSHLPRLKIMARNTVFRYRGSVLDPREIGQKLGVRAVLIGKMLQMNDCLTVSVELINVADGSLVWGGRFERPVSKILELEEEISREISEKLRFELTSEEKTLLKKRYTDNCEAYYLYLKGRYLWKKYTAECIQKGIEYFQQAIDLDAEYALAYAGLADSYFRLSNTYLPPKKVLPQAKTAALQAVSLGDHLSEVHTSLGMVKLYYDHDWRGAQLEYIRAIELNHNAHLAYQRYGMYLVYCGRFEEALIQFYRAQELDPLSLQVSVNKSACLYLMGHADKAIRELQKVIELESNFYPAHMTPGWVYVHEGRFKEAVAEAQEGFRIGKDYAGLGLLGYAYALSDKRRDAETVLNKLLRKFRRDYVSPYNIAIIYAALGKKDQAFKWLERAYEGRSDWLVWLKGSPERSSLREDSRYAELLKKVGHSS